MGLRFRSTKVVRLYSDLVSKDYGSGLDKSNGKDIGGGRNHPTTLKVVSLGTCKGLGKSTEHLVK